MKVCHGVEYLFRLPAHVRVGCRRLRCRSLPSGADTTKTLLAPGISLVLLVVYAAAAAVVGGLAMTRRDVA